MTETMSLTTLLQFLVGLIAIINPIGLLPVFVSLTGHMSPEEQRQTSTTANFAVMVILLVSLFIGKYILMAFGISIASFQIAGGMLILFIAFSMLQGSLGKVKHTAEEDRESAMKESIAVVPLAMPLMAGPGAISSVIVTSTQYTGLLEKLAMGGIIVLFSAMSWLLFRSGPVIFKLLGTTGINIITRIMGLIMGSIGIEVIAAGIKALFPGVAAA